MNTFKSSECHHSTRLAIVIGQHGHYSALRHHNDGDIHRPPLHPAAPGEQTGIARWMQDTSAAGGDMRLAEGLTYLFGRATCGLCGSTFHLADWLEAENSPGFSSPLHARQQARSYPVPEAASFLLR